MPSSLQNSFILFIIMSDLFGKLYAGMKPCMQQIATCTVMHIGAAIRVDGPDTAD